jgi:ribonuclease D
MAAETQEILVETPSALRTLVDQLRVGGRFAFDTEFVSEQTFDPVLCLAQVAADGRRAVIDTLAIEDLAPLWELVNDPAVEVVMHASGEDLRIGRLQSGALPARIKDVQVAAALVGYGYPLSLGNLVFQVLGISLAGGETRTDWRRRPLSESQIRYALDDVRHLLDLSDELERQIGELGRAAWAEEEYRGLIDRVQKRDDEDRWRRLPGLHHLSRRGLETARRLAEWRRHEAKRANRPIRQLLRDDLLVAIAKRQPPTRRDLEALRDFNRPQLLARSAQVLAVIAEAKAVAADDLPEHTERHDEGPGLAMLVSLLSAALTHCAVRNRVAASLVGTSSDLKDLARWFVEGRTEARRPDLARGWRSAVCGKALIDVLSGRSALRIVDPLANVPVELVPTADGQGPLQDAL